MSLTHPRLRREVRTIEFMIEIYCREKHGNHSGLCSDCLVLKGYALSRLERCPFQDNKPACAKCKVHCYKAEMREQIRRVMRFAGPRMLLRHPILSILHLWLDGSREAPELTRKTNPGR
jgi:hypothetical protein